MTHKFEIGEILVINSTAYDMKKHNGELAKVIDILPDSNVNDYLIKCNTSDSKLKVREEEVQEIKNKIILDLEIGQEVIYLPINAQVKINQINYSYEQVAIKFQDNGVEVVDVSKIRLIDTESDSEKEIDPIDYINTFIDVILGHYKNKDDTFTIPHKLLHNLVKNLFKEGDC